MKSLPERQEAAGLTLGASTLEVAICRAPTTSWTLALATAILESSLYLLAPVPRPTHQPVGNNTGAQQATSQEEMQRHPQASLLS